MKKPALAAIFNGIGMFLTDILEIFIRRNFRVIEFRFLSYIFRICLMKSRKSIIL